MISQLKAPVLGLIRLFKSLQMKKREEKKKNQPGNRNPYMSGGVGSTAARKDQHKV